MRWREVLAGADARRLTVSPGAAQSVPIDPTTPLGNRFKIIRWMGPMISVALIEDNRLVREGITAPET